MEEQFISSTQNPKVKRVAALIQKSSLRKETGLFVVEGLREVEHCIEAGFQPDAIFLCPEILGERPDFLQAAINGGQATFPVYNVTPEVYAKLVFREQKVLWPL